MDALGNAITDFAELIMARLAPTLTESDLGLLSSMLAGTAAALAVAIALTLILRLRSRRRHSWRGFAKGGFAALAALGLTGFVGYDMRHAALDYLGLNASRPAVEFEIKLPPQRAATSVGRDTQIELHTDRNQTLAKTREARRRRRWPAAAARLAAAGFPHQQPHVDPEPARPGAASVQAAARRQSQPLAAVRTLAAGRPRGLDRRRPCWITPRRTTATRSAIG